MPKGRAANTPIAVLLVEGSPQIEAELTLSLSEKENLYELQVARSFDESLIAVRKRQPTVVIMNFAALSGEASDLVKQMRNATSAFIYIVTESSDTDTILQGLEAGADDYHDHPVNCQHLVARIDALLRRATGAFHLENALHFGHLEIRPDEGRVYRDGKEISLTRTEFRLLCELATSPNKVFARETLLDRVWGYGYFGDGRLVDVHVRRLRTKIEVRPDEPQYVVTVRGLGYRFDGEKVKQH
jgi:DNA-binding response OmpR family regulator